MRSRLSKYSLEILCILLALALMLSGCSGESGAGGSSGESNTTSGENVEGDASLNYEMITMEEAQELMASEENYIILDVRRQNEYDAGHIPGAILVTNEEIGTGEGTAVWAEEEDGQAEEQVAGQTLAALPDKDQLILVYCRSGNRSKQASKKLVDLGYTNIKEFGGIMDWPGEIEY